MDNTPTATLPRLLAPINELLTPGIRAGLGNPLPLTSGFVILEVPGRKTGQLRSVPLLCADYGRALVVTTVRGNSQWVRNLAAAGQAFVWLRGRRRQVSARVYRNGELVSEAARDDGCWRALSEAMGVSLAVLSLD